MARTGEADPYDRVEVAVGFLDKLKGSKPAKEGVPPVSVGDLRSALLGLTRDTAPWQVRDGAEDGCDLVAEWRIVDAQWYGIFFQYGLNKVFRSSSGSRSSAQRDPRPGRCPVPR